MTDDLCEVKERLRATYQAVAATTVIGIEDPNKRATRNHEPAAATRYHRSSRLVIATATVAVLLGSAVAALISSEWHIHGSRRTKVATGPPATAVTTQPSESGMVDVAPTCGSQLPRSPDLPDGYRGPAQVASPVRGQLVLQWTSPTGTIEARWPADPEYQQMVGHNMAATPDDQPSVGASTSPHELRRTASGGYFGVIVFGLRNVSSECETLQMNVLDTSALVVERGVARLSNNGLFVSNAPLIVASEDRTLAPTVVACGGADGAAVPAKRGGSGTGVVYPTPATALKGLLETDSSLIGSGYLEIRLPDDSIAYAREQPVRPGSFVTVVHVRPLASGWSVDGWEASGC